MKHHQLGELEEMILLAACGLQGDASGATVQIALEELAGRRLTLSAVYSALDRLEKKGFLHSEMGEPTAERGGRRRRLFAITDSGREMLLEKRMQRSQLRSRIADPDLSGEWT